MTLFTKEYEVNIHKDKRLLECNVSLDICKAILKTCPDAAQKQAESKFSRELFFDKYHGKYFRVEAVNVRAESRVSRNVKPMCSNMAISSLSTITSDTSNIVDR